MEDRKDSKSVFQSESILKVILAMAVPTVISQMITVLYNYADTITISRALGKNDLQELWSRLLT